MEGEVTNLKCIKERDLIGGLEVRAFEVPTFEVRAFEVPAFAVPAFAGIAQKDFGSSVAPPIFAPSNEIQFAHTSSFTLSKLVSRWCYMHT